MGCSVLIFRGGEYIKTNSFRPEPHIHFKFSANPADHRVSPAPGKWSTDLSLASYFTFHPREKVFLPGLPSLACLFPSSPSSHALCFTFPPCLLSSLFPCLLSSLSSSLSFFSRPLPHFLSLPSFYVIFLPFLLFPFLLTPFASPSLLAFLLRCFSCLSSLAFLSSSPSSHSLYFTFFYLLFAFLPYYFQHFHSLLFPFPLPLPLPSFLFYLPSSLTTSNATIVSIFFPFLFLSLYCYLRPSSLCLPLLFSYLPYHCSFPSPLSSSTFTFFPPFIAIPPLFFSFLP